MAARREDEGEARVSRGMIKEGERAGGERAPWWLARRTTASSRHVRDRTGGRRQHEAEPLLEAVRGLRQLGQRGRPSWAGGAGEVGRLGWADVGLNKERKRGEGNRPGREEPREEELVFILFRKYVSSLILKLVLKTTYKPHHNKCSFN